ncbi:MAG: domain containing CoxE-like protein [Chthoniobacteraceae bacterium]|nr:domain containing CoxE-like protein [Chthoniobacteraceae bacterium]
MTVSSPSSFLDPAALMSIRNLELRARTVVEGFSHGLHRSPYHGFSVEFTEYRAYTPGDDPRHLDWRLVGRTDRYFIKKFEDETNLRCHLLVDQSLSMTFGSRGVTKADYARTLAATLAYFLAQQGDATGLLTFDEQVREYLPAKHRPGHLRHLMLALEKPAAGRSTDLAAPLKRVAELTRKRGLIVLLSDLLAPLESLEGPLALLTAARHEVIVFQILDPAELTFDFETASRFLDMETGRDLFLDPAAARIDYRARIDAHLAGVRALCERLGITHLQLPTSQPLEIALFDFLKARSSRGKLIRRKGAAS